ncbi:hypothetical protein [Bacillus phage Negev_SA]|uniref:Uncharacterized protein n=1 Tax=Bacillus phage Negev_SA TaxID=1983579 RepID=A0A288WGD8_9CAUD|nr:hypothetical protein P9C72_gp54 [Bacillus phage Negev_SA]ARW58502.1 hypothetical protein [Bacillus phage Negev_SA]
MKMLLTKHWCLDRNCGFEETSHKVRDGWKCPDCNGPMAFQQVNKKRRKRQVMVLFILEEDEGWKDRS